MPTFAIDGHDLFYTDQVKGAVHGTSLVLLHGAGGSHLHWPPRLRRLPGRAVYALDLPGHGRSRGPGLRSIAAYAEGLHRFVQALDLPAFLLVGHSMGAAIALQFALRPPSGLAGLALIGAGARLRVAPAILDGLLNDFAAATALIADLAYAVTTDDRQRQLFRRRLRETDPAVLHGDFVACDAFDVRAHLNAIDLPALIVCGQEDRLTPVKGAELLAAGLPHGELHLVSNAGHMAMIEQPDAVTALLRDFAARCDRRVDGSG